MSSKIACPDCGKPLTKVTRSALSPLNEDQFDSVRAGDWFCDACPGNGRSNTSFRYFWDRELMQQTETNSTDYTPSAGEQWWKRIALALFVLLALETCLLASFMVEKL